MSRHEKVEGHTRDLKLACALDNAFPFPQIASVGSRTQNSAHG